ncbi:MAG TPA: ribonuclease Z [Anaerolineae bacterium]|nr:ribonuclease Z [Anaerolineae bacterium]
MARLVLLGTAAAVPDASHENTYIVLEGPSGSIMIDCGGGPIGRLEQAGVPHLSLRSVIITHIHPDHAYGFPLLLMGLWLLGRTARLQVHALDNVAARLRAVMDAYEWREWPRFYPVQFEPIEDRVGAPVLDNGDFRITAARNEHMVPTLALRIENKANGYVVAYSSDTAPCAAVVELARGADLLIHEAAGATPGHSSAAMAGEVAREADVKKLVLVHYQVTADPDALAAEAQAAFGRPVEVAQDMAEYMI